MLQWTVFKQVYTSCFQNGSIRKLCAKMCPYVFVYGTLKQREPNHHWLTNPEHGVGKFITTGVTETKYPLIIATRYNIPFLLYSPGDGYHVKGEVYEVDETMLTKLDILEDHPDFYERQIDNILVDKKELEKETIQCWVYFLKNFRPELRSKPAMEDYTSSGPHGLRYLERSQRDPKYDYFPEVKV